MLHNTEELQNEILAASHHRSCLSKILHVAGERCKSKVNVAFIHNQLSLRRGREFAEMDKILQS